MKYLFTKIAMVCFIGIQLFAGQVDIRWSPPWNSPDIDGYNIYQSTNAFKGGTTNKITLGDVTNAIVTNFDDFINSYHVTAFNTSGRESDPSNEIRFRLLSSDPSMTNYYTMAGFTNWSNIVLARVPTNGILSGTPPNLSYFLTNKAAFKDGFVYSVAEKEIISSGANKRFTVVHATNKITIDGNLSDWPTRIYEIVNPTFYIPKGSDTNGTLVTFEKYDPAGATGTNTWTGLSDHSVTIKAFHDYLNLYLAVTVTDDFHENPNNSYFSGDSLQITAANSNRTSVVALMGFGLGGRDGSLSNSPVINYTGTNPPPTAAIVRNSTTKTTTYEICLHSETINARLWMPGTDFGLGICVNEGDPTAPGQRGWSGFGPHSVVFGQTAAESVLFRTRSEDPVTNYFTLRFSYPNTAPTITDIDVIGF